MSTSADLFGSNAKLLSLRNDPPQVPHEEELLAAVTAKVGPFAGRDKLLYHIRISAGKVHWAVNSYLRSVLAAPCPSREDFDSKTCQTWHLTAANDSKCNIQETSSTVASCPSAASAASGPGQCSQPVPAQQATCSPACCSSSTSQQPQQQREQHNQSGRAVDFRTVDVSSRTSTPAADLQATAACSSVRLDMLPGSALENVFCLLDLSSLMCAASSCKMLYEAAQSERIWKQLFHQRWGKVLFPTSKHATHTCGSSGRSQQAVSTAQTDSSHSSHTTATGPVVKESSRRAIAADTTDTALHHHRLASTASVASEHRTAGADVATPAASLHIRSDTSEDGFISLWTGSSVNCNSASPCAMTPRAVVPRQVQAAVGTVGPTHQQTGQHNNSSISCRCRSCTALPACAPAGSWKQQYRQQYSYQAARKCPKCGSAGVVPVVYGFPSGPLLAGVGKKRLLLGGDHLIDSCHVWACSCCRSCYRYFPYGDVQLWLQDDEAQQQLDNARSAACRGRAAAAARGAAGAEPQHLESAAGGANGFESGGSNPSSNAAAGLPRYTYEL